MWMDKGTTSHRATLLLQESNLLVDTGRGSTVKGTCVHNNLFYLLCKLQRRNFKDTHYIYCFCIAVDSCEYAQLT